MRRTFKQILQDIDKTPAAVYLFSGEENFQKEGFLKTIVSTIPEELVSFNYDVFNGGESSGEEIVSRALTFPFGASRRLVVVRGAELLTEKDRERILSYLDAPSENTLLILMAEVKKAQGSFFTEVARRGVEIDFKTMYGNEIVPWLRNRASVQGKRLTLKAAYELREHAGSNLRLLANELEKLSVQVGKREEIGIEDVELSVGESRLRTGFEFVDAIGNKSETIALNILSSLLQQGKSAPEIIGLLAWQLRRIWRVKIHMEAGMKPPEIARAVKLPRFAVRGLVAQAGKFSHSKLEESLFALLDTDIKTKSGEIPALALELLVIRLCHS